ncbi:MAG: hypothetical protein IJJ77_06570 [Paludibacteraceae bacterium]|nr:hypothetical protein [Paludibacteraceae bacterium]
MIENILNILNLNANLQKPTISGEEFKHDYVNLGLPSGRLWATCNIGASIPTQQGNYFAWGEKITRSNEYCFSNYKWAQCVYPGALEYLIKYSTTPLWHDDPIKFDSMGEPIYIAHWEGHEYQLDHKSALETSDDAATNWSNLWKMPTKKDFEELMEGCYWKWANSFNGSKACGKVGISKTNNNVIFLPINDMVSYQFDNNDNGYYWASEIDEKNNDEAYALTFNPNEMNVSSISRCKGLSVRAVLNERECERFLK